MVSPIISIKSKNFLNVEQNLKKVLRNAVMDEVKKAVDKGAEDTAFIAREMAPIKTGKLEEAIEVAPGRKNYASGLVYISSVWVRPTVYNSIAHRAVREYASTVHEELDPAGPKRLGVLSRQKDEMVQHQVGGHFLTRALEVTKPLIIKSIVEALDKAIQKL